MIRRAQEKDIHVIMDLLGQVLEVHHKARPDLFKPNASKYTPEQLEEILQDETRPIFVLTEEDDRPLGYAFCILQQHLNDNILTDIKTLYIDDICVDSNARHKQVGQRLYEYVKDYARQIGCYNVTLNVWAGNDGAQKFYETMGLKPQKIGMEVILEEE